MSSAWNAFLGAIAAARQELKLRGEEECFFRGHGVSDWNLLPTLLRYCQESGRTRRKQITDLEATLFFEFRSRARELHGQGLDGWDVLFHMRHHGLATRLLDWTETLAVAVYFALRDSVPRSVPCVWLLNPYALNQLSWEVRDLVAPEYLPQGEYDFTGYLVGTKRYGRFDWEQPVALYPLQRNADSRQTRLLHDPWERHACSQRQCS